MGLRGPKSLLEVKDGLTFLDLIVRQILGIRRRAQWRIPLVLMNSFATDGETQIALCGHPDLAADIAATFVQNRFPKLRPDDLMPVSWPETGRSNGRPGARRPVHVARRCPACSGSW